MVDISIIIVNYNVKEYIMPCIESIYKTIGDDISFEVIMIDNDSKDKSVELIRSEFPEVSIFQNSYNRGFSSGVNQGASNAKGSFILVLNPDTLVQENCIQKLMDFISHDVKIAAVGPRMIEENGLLLQSYWRFPTLLNTLISLFHLDKLNRSKNYGSQSSDNPMEVDSISGGAILIRKAVFKGHSGFDNNLFWMEDIDFCYRAKNNGYRIMYFPKAKIIHHQGKSAEKNLQWAIANQLSSKIKYFKKHGTYFDRIILSTSILIVSIFKIILFFLLTPFQSIYKSKLMGNWKAIKWILSGQPDEPLLT